mmetsp:Transcript_104393/g.336612  ORF Transcript_104393/g.336612 Transcript_104393/m.336612 type:complete len:210 (+) Transcript_104393:98-727(+)
MGSSARAGLPAAAAATLARQVSSSCRGFLDAVRTAASSVRYSSCSLRFSFPASAISRSVAASCCCSSSSSLARAASSASSRQMAPSTLAETWRLSVSLRQAASSSVSSETSLLSRSRRSAMPRSRGGGGCPGSRRSSMGASAGPALTAGGGCGSLEGVGAGTAKSFSGVSSCLHSSCLPSRNSSSAGARAAARRTAPWRCTSCCAAAAS